MPSNQEMYQAYLQLPGRTHIQINGNENKAHHVKQNDMGNISK